MLFLMYMHLNSNNGIKSIGPVSCSGIIFVIVVLAPPMSVDRFYSQHFTVTRTANPISMRGRDHLYLSLADIDGIWELLPDTRLD